MLIAHLSDLHLRDAGDVVWLERQLDCVARRDPVHLAVTGDLLDRWDPYLFEAALDAFGSRGFLSPELLTLFHGNHDLASSGGHPRRTWDLWRMVLRFWDPPPLVVRRRRQFYERLGNRAVDIGGRTPLIKQLAGFRVAVVDTVPAPWKPVRFRSGTIVVQHAIGCVREAEMDWLAAQRGSDPLVLLIHHYPLDPPEYTWSPLRHDFSSRFSRLISTVVKEVAVPMAIVEPDRERFWRACAAANVKLVLCGHLHRQRLERYNGIAVGLNGQSGAEWAGRTVAFYEVGDSVRVEVESMG